MNCLAKDCKNDTVTRGVCTKHYHRWARGDDIPVLPPLSRSEIGRRGGKALTGMKGFALDKERASRAGQLGGRNGRGKTKNRSRKVEA